MDYSSLQGAWPNEGDLPGNRGPWKSIQKVQQLLRELGIIEAIYTPVCEGHIYCRNESQVLRSSPAPGSDADVHAESSWDQGLRFLCLGMDLCEGYQSIYNNTVNKANKCITHLVVISTMKKNKTGQGDDSGGEEMLF